MNEENNQFSVDVAAESQVISPSLQPDEISPSEFITVLKDIPVPEPLTLEPTPVEADTKVGPAISKLSGIDFVVKIDAEEAYERTKTLEQQVLQLNGGISDIYNEMKSSWLPNKDRDDFEERPTTEPNNLIFNERRDRSSMFPPFS